MAKGPKVLNPADKARKEARKKELKKNKKQREQVRSAVIKGRDPEQILVELDNLDKLEYDPKNCDQQQQPNAELIYRDKRKRLKELLQRILIHYQKEETERYEQLKQLESDYEARHKRAEREYAAIKAAKEVKIDEVFLPPEAAISIPGIDETIADDDPLMSESVYITPLTEDVTPPGCPQGPPPDLRSLVDSLKDSFALAAMMAPTSLPPPAPASRVGKNFIGSHKNLMNTMHRKPGQSLGFKSQHHPSQRGQQTGVQLQAPSSSQQLQDDAINNKPMAENKKAAVIESKPVIFIPKATKFVPSSVRSKNISKASKQER